VKKKIARPRQKAEKRELKAYFFLFEIIMLMENKQEKRL